MRRRPPRGRRTYSSSGTATDGSTVNGADATEQLDRGAIDVAVARLVNIPTRLHAQTLMQDPFVVAARRGHPLAGGPMSIEDYVTLKHILITPRGNTFGSVDRFLAAGLGQLFRSRRVTPGSALRDVEQPP